MAQYKRTPKIRLSETEFNYLIGQMCVDMSAKAVQAAYLVLVNGMSQKAAFEQAGSSASNVNGTVKRIIDRHLEIMDVYTERFNQKVAVMRVVQPHFDFTRGNDNGEDKEAKAG